MSDVFYILGIPDYINRRPSLISIISVSYILVNLPFE